MSGRDRLREARRERGMTQQQVAGMLDITVRQYQNIESGKTMGKIALWDALEDLFGVHQRRLRDVSAKKPNCPSSETIATSSDSTATTLDSLSELAERSRSRSTASEKPLNSAMKSSSSSHCASSVPSVRAETESSNDRDVSLGMAYMGVALTLFVMSLVFRP